MSVPLWLRPPERAAPQESMKSTGPATGHTIPPPLLTSATGSGSGAGSGTGSGSGPGGGSGGGSGGGGDPAGAGPHAGEVSAEPSERRREQDPGSVAEEFGDRAGTAPDDDIAHPSI
jgi:hypothetical protein